MPKTNSTEKAEKRTVVSKKTETPAKRRKTTKSTPEKEPNKLTNKPRVQKRENRPPGKSQKPNPPPEPMEVDDCGAVKAVVEKKLTTLVLYGDANIPMWIRGYRRTPLNKLKKRLLDRAYKHQNDVDVVFVDEYRTTVLCSWCNSRCKVSKKGHRYLHCTPCKRTWNRDINAAQNILNVGLIRKDRFSSLLYIQHLSFET